MKAGSSNRRAKYPPRNGRCRTAFVWPQEYSAGLGRRRPADLDTPASRNPAVPTVQRCEVVRRRTPATGESRTLEQDTPRHAPPNGYGASSLAVTCWSDELQATASLCWPDKSRVVDLTPARLSPAPRIRNVRPPVGPYWHCRESRQPRPVRHQEAPRSLEFSRHRGSRPLSAEPLP